jgi:hypothetical protein
MAKWMLVLLNEGKLSDGAPLFSPATWRQLSTLVTPIPTGPPDPLVPELRANFNGYALGLGVRDYRGRKVVQHSGGLPGCVSRVVMLPEAQLGITVLTNQESGSAISAIVYHLADYYLDAPAKDWLGAFQQLAARAEARLAETKQRAAAARDTASRPSLSLEKYAGTYEDAWYGEVGIALEGGKLVMRFSRTPALVGELEHWQHDTFVVRWRDRELRADAYVTFALNPDGSIDQVKMRPASPDVDFSFDFQDLLLKPVKLPAR